MSNYNDFVRRSVTLSVQAHAHTTARVLVWCWLALTSLVPAAYLMGSWWWYTLIPGMIIVGAANECRARLYSLREQQKHLEREERRKQSASRIDALREVTARFTAATEEIRNQTDRLNPFAAWTTTQEREWRRPGYRINNETIT